MLDAIPIEWIEDEYSTPLLLQPIESCFIENVVIPLEHNLKSTDL